MPQFNDNIRRLATQNTDFRREILTNQQSQPSSAEKAKVEVAIGTAHYRKKRRR